MHLPPSLFARLRSRHCGGLARRGWCSASGADGKLRAMAIVGMGGAVGGVEVGAVLVLISCFSHP